MKKQILSLLLVAGTGACISGCVKDNSNVMPAIGCTPETATAPAAETDVLKHRLDSMNISSVMQDARGFFYKMDSASLTAADEHATACSGVAVTYSIARLGDTVFEKSDSVVAISLSYTNVPGLKEAIPIMKKNAIMTLYLPPSLAYGSTGYKTVPGNTYITFIIKLYDFSK